MNQDPLTNPPRFQLKYRSGIVAIYDTQHPEFRETPGCDPENPWVVWFRIGRYVEPPDPECPDGAGHWTLDPAILAEAEDQCRILNIATRTTANRPSMVVRVLGYTLRDGALWDMICHNDTLGTITVDPWVGCALPPMTDDQKRALVGKEFTMLAPSQHPDGAWTCWGFSPAASPSTPNPAPTP